MVKMNEKNIVLRANNISAGYGEQIIIRNINLNNQLSDLLLYHP